MLKKAVIGTAGLLLLNSGLWAQESRSQFALSATIDLSKQTQFTQQPSGLQHGLQVVQAPTRTEGGLASYRFAFAKKHSLEFNYGYLRNNQRFTFTDLTNSAQTSVSFQTAIHEATGAYVFRPFQFGRISPFLLLGGGVLIFRPTGTPIYGPSSQTKNAVLYGAGADFKLTRRLAFRGQFRGLLYRPPNFYLSGFLSGHRGNLKEPSLGIVYHF